MSLLSPPAPPTRHRASSTSVQTQLSLPSLSPRSRANTLTIATPSPTAATFPDLPSRPPTPEDFQREKVRQSKRSMFPVLVSRTILLFKSLRSKRKFDELLDSGINTPRSSTDTDYILPLSAGPSKTTFNEKELVIPTVRARWGWLPSVHTPVLVVLILFPLSTALVLFALSTLPVAHSWPRTLQDLAQVGRDLNSYAQSGHGPTLHVLAVLSLSALWKHAWSIPGSVLWNVLAGALFHPLLATLLLAFLTTLGSVCATLLATPLAPILTRLFPRPIELTRTLLEGSPSSSFSSWATASPPSTSEPEQEGKSSPASLSSVSQVTSSSTPAWVRLSILRLIGLVPWAALNIACGLARTPLWDCFLGAFIGSLPWTAVTCQIGDILHTFTKSTVSAAAAGAVAVVGGNATDILFDVVVDGAEKVTIGSVLATPQMIFELAFLTVLSLAPILGRDKLRSFLSPSSITTPKSPSEISLVPRRQESLSSTSSSTEDDDMEDVDFSDDLEKDVPRPDAHAVKFTVKQSLSGVKGIRIWKPRWPAALTSIIPSYGQSR